MRRISLSSVACLAVHILPHYLINSTIFGGKSYLTFGAGIIFLILAHPVYKMWIIQERNKLALWNKLHFEEKKTESIEHV